VPVHVVLRKPITRLKSPHHLPAALFQIEIATSQAFETIHLHVNLLYLVLFKTLTKAFYVQ